MMMVCVPALMLYCLLFLINSRHRRFPLLSTRTRIFFDLVSSPFSQFISSSFHLHFCLLAKTFVKDHISEYVSTYTSENFILARHPLGLLIRCGVGHRFTRFFSFKSPFPSRREDDWTPHLRWSERNYLLDRCPRTRNNKLLVIVIFIIIAVIFNTITFADGWWLLLLPLRSCQKNKTPSVIKNYAGDEGVNLAHFSIFYSYYYYDHYYYMWLIFLQIFFFLLVQIFLIFCKVGLHAFISIKCIKYGFIVITIIIIIVKVRQQK